MASVKKNLPQTLKAGDQIAIWESLGLEIGDKSSAEKFLWDVPQARLDDYSFALKDVNGRFKPSATFESLKALYEFDMDLREILLSKLSKIEDGFTARLVDFFTANHGPAGYVDRGALDAAGLQNDDVIASIRKEIRREEKKNNPVVIDFRDNYVEGVSTFDYAANNFLSFGIKGRFYKAMTGADKTAFCRDYYDGVDVGRFETWINSMVEVRNLCSHPHRVYGIVLQNEPVVLDSKGMIIPGVFGVLVCMKRILSEEDTEDFVDSMVDLAGRYPDVDLSVMGFPAKWDDFLLNGEAL